MNNFETYNFNNLGYIFTSIPDQIKNLILEEIEEVKNNRDSAIDVRHKLVGNITSEYELVKSIPILSDFVVSACEYYIEKYGYTGNIDHCSSDISLILKDLWVNFQKKGDFNPIHNHRGLFSFVIWVKIPYDLEDELKVYQNSSRSMASLFRFHYINCVGEFETETLPVNKSWEWKMILFPSKINHSVNPFFTSDEDRISIAGNVFIELTN
jgi:hypothetical protein